MLSQRKRWRKEMWKLIQVAVFKFGWLFLFVDF